MAFLGIKVPLEVGRLLRGIDVPGINEGPSEYHITLLCFEDNWKLSEVSKALEATYEIVSNIKPFLVKTDTVTCFPKREGKPIPIIAKVESKELHDLRDKLAKKFDKEKIDFSKTFKDFKPHITLSYYDSEKEIDKINIDPVEFSVQEIVLWAGDHGDDRLFITFPLKAPQSEKKSSFLWQKAHMFCKIASNSPQNYLTSTYNRRKFDRTVLAEGNHFIPNMDKLNEWMNTFNGDFAAKMKEYKEYGGWTQYSYKLIPVNDIEVKPIWSQSKFDNTLKEMKNGLPVVPVRLEEHYNMPGTWAITDGIHRIAASKEMGYTHVPAFVAEWITEPPPVSLKQNEDDDLDKVAQIIRKL